MIDEQVTASEEQYEAKFGKLESIRASLSSVENSEQLWQFATQPLTSLGMRSFNMSYMFTACWENLTGLMRYASPWHQELIHQIIREETEVYVHAFLYGAGFCSSCCAIEQLIAVEHNHRGILEHERHFGIIRKFMNVKIMVPFVFLQSIVRMIPPFRDWSQTRFMVFHGTMFVVECLLLSIFYWWAWQPGEEWYDKVKLHRVPRTTNVPRSAPHTTNRPPSTVRWRPTGNS